MGSERVVRAVPGGGIARPVSLAGQRCVEVLGALAPLFPDQGMRRGSTITVAGATAGSGVVSLAIGMLSQVTQEGGWCAVVGMPSLGLVAASQLGVRLDRLALVPAPGAQWAVAVAALLDSMEVVVTAPVGSVRLTDARRLAARARERGSVLVVVETGGWRWPERAEVRLRATAGSWSGLEGGFGVLASRVVEVEVSGRGAATQARHCRLLLPDGNGMVAAAPPADGAGEAGGEVLPLTGVG